MAEEENNEQEAEATEAEAPAETEAEAPEADAPEAPEAEAPDAEPEAAAEAPEPEAEPEPEPEAAPEPEPAPAPAPAAAGGEEAPAEALGPKERRKRARSQHTGEAAAPRTDDERAEQRAAAKKAKIASRSRRRHARRAKKGEARPGTPPAEREPGTRKLQQGIVTSAKADKTITVDVQSARRHPSYEKIVRRSKGLHAHDENNEAGEGDTVRVIEARPMSKTKRWRLVEVVEKAK